MCSRIARKTKQEFCKEDTVWERWVRKVFVGTAGRSATYTGRLHSVDTEGVAGRLLVALPLFTQDHAHHLSQLLGADVGDHIFLLAITSTDFLDFLPLVHFPLLNQATVAHIKGERVMLWEFYQAGPDGERRHNYMGGWPLRGQSHQALKATLKEDVVSRRTNLTGLHIRCLTLKYSPFLLVQELDDGTLRLSGWMGDLWQEVQSRTNFTYNCVYPEDGNWGKLQNEGGADGGGGGTWNGMIGELVAGLADVIVAPMDHTFQRSTVVDFCFGFTSLRYKLVLRRPTSQSYMWTNYTREFEAEVWVVIALFLIGVAFLVFCTTRFSPSETHVVTLGEALLMTLGSFCRQSTSLNVSSGAARAVMSIIYLTTTLLFVYYTCFLISNLTVSSVSPPFTSLQGVYDDGTYDLGYMKSTSINEVFQFAQDGIYRLVWQHLVEPAYAYLPRDDATGIERALAERYVHLIDETNFLTEYADHCDLLMLPNAYHVTPTTFAVSKGSPLRRVLNHHLTQLRETGIFMKYWHKWLPKQAHCPSRKVLTACTLTNVMTAFLQLLGFSVLAFTILAVEIYISRKHKVK
ncbi:glutamate receptor 2-like [Panulirus ornatus]|uniref:glutamate receptor 2-like n=1 Tax=Panulirus ornatus TaxID=150431 RepID=UPI003A8AB8FE